MSSLSWLGLTALIVVALTLMGLDPKGGKPIERTRLVKMSRLILIGGALTCAVFGSISYFMNR